jgi:nucleotide-binding universal stress UspA family protein
MKLLVAVDGSASSTRSTEKLLQTLGWYREQPTIELLAVHLPVPRLPNMNLVISEHMLEQYYAEECEAMLGPSQQLLDKAGVHYTAHTRVGPVAESIIEQAKHSSSDMIYMGTRGMSALPNMLLGSVATKVLHLAQIPVVLIH